MTEITRLPTEAQYVSIKVNQQGTLFAIGCFDGHVFIYDLFMIKQVMVIQTNSQAVCAISWSRNGRLLATGSIEKLVKVWDICNDICLSEIELRTEVYSVDFHPRLNNELLICSVYRAPLVWNFESGQCFSFAKASGGDEWGQDALSDDYDALIKAQQSKELTAMDDYLSLFQNFSVSSYSANGDYTLLGSNKAKLGVFKNCVLVGCCDLNEADAIQNASSGSFVVRQIEFARHGSVFAVRCSDKTIRIYNFESVLESISQNSEEKVTLRSLHRLQTQIDTLIRSSQAMF